MAEWLTVKGQSNFLTTSVKAIVLEGKRRLRLKREYSHAHLQE